MQPVPFHVRVSRLLGEFGSPTSLPPTEDVHPTVVCLGLIEQQFG